MSTSSKRGGRPKHSFSHRADAITAVTAANSDPILDARDQFIDSHQLAALLGVSVSWLEQARHHGEGPKWVKLGPRCVRYKRSAVADWLQERARESAADYDRKVAEMSEQGAS